MSIRHVAIVAIAWSALSTAAFAADAQMGRELFNGTKPFANGGASCLSCHSVGAPAGGTLAKDLKDVYTRYGDAGLDGVLKTLPFPIMKDIYANKLLTQDEISSLKAYFQETAEAPQQPMNSSQFPIIGVVGAIGLFAGMAVFWPRRRQSVRDQLRGGRR